MTFPRFFGLLLVLGGCTSETDVSTLYPEMGVTPSTLEFGEVVANEEVKPLELYISNGGPVDLEISDMSFGDPAFSYELPEGEDLVIGSDEQLTVMVSFVPTELRSYDTDLVITSNDREKPEWTVPITAVGRVPYAPEIEIRAPGQAVPLEPLVLDFGSISVGNEGQKIFEIHNVGDANLVIDSVTQLGAGSFSLDPIANLNIAPGTSRTYMVTYDAVHEDGDSGSISIPNNDPDDGENPTVIQFEANGGGVFDYPVAVIDCPGTVELAEPVVVTLDGSGSTDPFGGTLTYEWAMVQLPAGVDPTRTVDPTDAAVTNLLIDAAGTWEVSLTVTNDLGIPSVPSKCLIEAVPIDNLHVELTWNGGTSDFDLHLALEDAPFFSVPGEVSWCNRLADWGVAGELSDDGHLDLDDHDGYGPENAGVTIPADGIYRVRVHAFDDGDDGSVTANVSVFLNGDLEWQGSQVLDRNEVWEVGQINWPDATFGVVTEEPWDAMGVRECQ
jgi:hypothetical protein